MFFEIISKIIYLGGNLRSALATKGRFANEGLRGIAALVEKEENHVRNVPRVAHSHTDVAASFVASSVGREGGRSGSPRESSSRRVRRTTELPPDSNMSTTVCYKCNRPGHFARECNSGREMKERDVGYRGVSDAGFGRGREKCYKCNRQGHFARDCKEEADRCYRCSGTGHIARECTQSPDEPSCYNCHKVGHISRNCPEGMPDRDGRNSTLSCYNCNKTGHISRNCPDGTKTCYNCNQTGHISRDCDQNENN